MEEHTSARHASLVSLRSRNVAFVPIKTSKLRGLHLGVLVWHLARWLFINLTPLLYVFVKFLRKGFLLRQPLPDPRHKSCDNRLSQQNAITKCHYKLSQQFVTTNQSKISSISDTFICFPHGKWCKCT